MKIKCPAPLATFERGNIWKYACVRRLDDEDDDDDDDVITTCFWAIKNVCQRQALDDKEYHVKNASTLLFGKCCTSRQES